MESLTRVLGPDGLQRGADVSARHARDMSSAAALTPPAVLRPRSTAELSAALQACHEHRQAVVIQGGLTGLCGGATPRREEFALSLERMNRIEEIDPLGMTATVEAGVILEQLQHAATGAQCRFPLDFGARGSCTIGGNLACNAGGNSVIRYGVARELCLGLEVVLADGTVLSQMNRMAKNTSGYDLKQLFIGSEGTLGVIARAVVRLYPELHDRATAMIAAESFDAVLAILKRARAELGASLCAFEVMWRNYLEEVRRRLPQVRMPVGAGSNRIPSYAILLEIEMQSGATELLTHFLQEASAAGEIGDAMLAQSQAQSDDCWALRDAIAQLLQIYAHSVAFDVSLPLATMRTYSEQVAASLAAEFPSTTALCFGHLGDGTLHYIVDAPDTASKERILDLVLQPLADYGGAVSAEHGIGVAKRDYLALCRSAAEISQMRRLKSWLDPHDILNPGRVFD